MYTTVRPEIFDKSTILPLVARSSNVGMTIPSRWSHAPSSIGTGNPPGKVFMLSLLAIFAL